MKPRLVAVGLGAVMALLGFAACGSDSGAGAPTLTTVNIGVANYVTALPVMTSTTIAALAVGATAVPGTPAGEQIYKVQNGDALYSIAKKHCLEGLDSAQLIADFNRWPDGVAHPIWAGIEVKIPPGGCVPAPVTTQVTTAAATVTQPAVVVDPIAPGEYPVQPGDYLSGIAAKLGTTVEAIVAVNGWSDGDQHVLIAGQKIKVPGKVE